MTVDVTDSKASTSPNLPAAFCVVAAGISAALHIGKLPPALPVLERVLGISLLQAGFLLSLVQLAGMSLGLVTGLAVQRTGLRRSMMAGLLLLGCASALGALAESVVWLLASRALEGLGFLWVVLPGPGMLRLLVHRDRLNSMLGVWGTYMPLGASLALVLGPWAMLLGSPDGGWRVWWGLLAAVAVAMAVVLAWRVPTDRPSRDRGAIPGQPAADLPQSPSMGNLLGLTLRSRPAWLMALTFAVYSGQWLAVVGFLPSIYAKAGIAITTAAWLTALAASLNMVGNLVAGRLLERGVRPISLLRAGFMVMGTGAVLAFGLPVGPWLQYASVLAFSMVGGLIPATLFSLSIRLAPSPAAVSTTIGWMQQWSSAGQFAVPPLVAWVAVYTGGWQWTAGVSAACCAIGLLLATQIHAELKRKQHA
jgi:predicted MFS family arabinose efflux permease